MSVEGNSPIKSYFVLRLPDPEGLAPVADRGGQDCLVDQVELLLSEPVDALVIVELDPEVLVGAPPSDFMTSPLALLQ